MGTSNYARRINWGMLLLGTFSQTQVTLIGSIGISELVVFLAAPVIFFQDLEALKKNGFIPFLWLSLLLIMGCCIASLWNHTPFAFFIRGFASVYSIPAIAIVVHRLVRRNMSTAVSSFAIGLILTTVISTFAFQNIQDIRAAEGGMKDITEGQLFWVSRIAPWVFLPIRGWYLSTPHLYSVFVPIAFAFFALFSTASGRSSALSGIAATAIIIIGGKAAASMNRLSRNLYTLMGVAVIGVIVLNAGYRVAAMSGILGEKAEAKFVAQTKNGTGVLQVLIGGRAEAFCSFYAALDRPLIGFGPWAQDSERYWERFMSEYGAPEDLEQYLKTQAFYESQGMGRAKMIPAHTMIGQFWVWFGIFGLVFWLYVLRLFFQYMRRYIASVPHWFGFLAAGMPGVLWNVFFSPFGNRVYFVTFITFVLIVRAIGQGKIFMPMDMVIEAERRAVRGRR